MPDIFLNSVDGSDANSGADWSNEKLTLATGIAGIDAAGDRCLIDSAHTESATAITYTSPGTAANPMQLLSVTPTGAAGVSALTAGATFTCTSTSQTWDGSFYAYGLNLVASAGSLNIAKAAASNQVWHDCTFSLTGTSGSSRMTLGTDAANGGSFLHLRNPVFRTGATGQRIAYSGDVRIDGGSWSASGTDPVAVFIPYGAGGGGRGSSLLVQGFDFSNLPSTVDLVGVSQGGCQALFRDIIVPASWSGAPISSASVKDGQRVEVWGYTISGGAFVRFWVRDTRCDLTPEDTIVRTGGASDSAAYSVRMVTTANCSYPAAVAVSPTFSIVNTTTGSALTVTAYIIHDSVTALDDDEIWLEVEEPDGTITTDAAASVIATPAAQTSGGTWTTTGLTNPNAQALAVSINASRAGTLLCRVMCAKPSKTLYICPEVTVG